MNRHKNGHQNDGSHLHSKTYDHIFNLSYRDIVRSRPWPEKTVAIITMKCRVFEREWSFFKCFNGCLAERHSIILKQPSMFWNACLGTPHPCGWARRPGLGCVSIRACVAWVQVCYQILLWSSWDLGQVAMYKNKPHWFPVPPKLSEGGDRPGAAVATALLSEDRGV